MSEAQAVETVDVRELLKERARLLARPVAELAAGAGRSVVVFSLGDERYGLETRYVFSVTRVCDVFPLPGAASHVLGLTNVHGELLVVFDLRVLMGSARPARGDATRLMVVGTKHPELAFIADSVHDVQALQDCDLFPLPASSADGEKPFLIGVTREAVSVFDGSALLTDARLYVDETGAGLLP